MDNFKVIYRILKYLETSLDYEELDVNAISPERLGITRARLEQLLIMLQSEGYISGIVCTQELTDRYKHITEPIYPVITLKGLEYLADNSLMKKAAAIAKGVRDMLP